MPMKPMAPIFLSLAGLMTVYSLAAQDRLENPVMEKQVQPEYPPELKTFLIEPARVSLVIDQEGDPFSVKSATSLPDNVVQAFTKWRFRPARKNGAAAASMVTVLVPIHRPVEERIASMRRLWSRPKEIDDAFAAAKGLDEAGASRLEERLKSGPGDELARLELLAYATAAPGPNASRIRLEQVLWFAKNNPQSGVLSAPYGIPAPPAPSQAAAYEEIRRIWLAQLGANPKDLAILDHATNFLRFSDPETVEKASLAANNETDRGAVFLGDDYGIAAIGITTVDPLTGRGSAAGEQLPGDAFALKARSALAATADLRIVLSALSTVAGAGPALAKTGHVPAGYAAFCQQLLARAKNEYPEIGLKCDATSPPLVNPTKILVGGNVQQANLIKKVPPSYPPEAKARGITGTVSFKALIGRDGSIHHLELLGGPLALYKSAREAVQRWVYRPTTLNGDPVEVVTAIDVNYTMNR